MLLCLLSLRLTGVVTCSSLPLTHSTHWRWQTPFATPLVLLAPPMPPLKLGKMGFSSFTPTGLASTKTRSSGGGPAMEWFTIRSNVTPCRLLALFWACNRLLNVPSSGHFCMCWLRTVLASRTSEVQVVKVKGHSSNPLNDAADSAAKSGASLHHTAAFLTARSAYWKLHKLAVSRQRLLLFILVERFRIAKSKHLLSFSKPSREQCASSAPRTAGDEYLLIARVLMVCACSFHRPDLSHAVSDTALASSVMMLSPGM